MIAANELRIGNLVFEPECEPHYFPVEEIRKYIGYELWVYYRHGSIKTKSPEPIPLTEEWLVRFGFDKSERRTDWDYKLPISGINLYSRFNKEWYFELDGIYLGSKPKYVHQLQNLYCSLTGEELTLREEVKP